MNAAQLLKEAELLTHHARLQWMVEVGRLPAWKRELVLAELTVNALDWAALGTSCKTESDANLIEPTLLLS